MATGDLVNGELECAWLDSLATVGDSLHALDKKAFKKAIKKMKEGKKDEKKNLLDKLNFLFKKRKTNFFFFNLLHIRCNFELSIHFFDSYILQEILIQFPPQ